jgi:5-(carboxyamino)imidazole ribonucleotide mutase
MPDDMFAYAESRRRRGPARHHRRRRRGRAPARHAGGQDHVPVLGVPVASRHLQGVDSLHSIVQMPKGMPVATFAIGAAGAANAALFAVAMLAAPRCGPARHCSPSVRARPKPPAP